MPVQQRKAFAYWLLGYTFLIVIASTNLPSPLYEVYRRTWHLSAGIIALIFATYALCLIPSLLVFGRLSDHVGRRKIIALGLVVAAAGTLCLAFAPSPVWLFIARALQGITVGAISGAMTAALVELHPRQERQAAALIVSTATVAGAGIGPLIAGALGRYGPWSCRT